MCVYGSSCNSCRAGEAWAALCQPQAATICQLSNTLLVDMLQTAQAGALRYRDRAVHFCTTVRLLKAEAVKILLYGLVYVTWTLGELFIRTQRRERAGVDGGRCSLSWESRKLPRKTLSFFSLAAGPAIIPGGGCVDSNPRDLSKRKCDL